MVGNSAVRQLAGVVRQQTSGCWIDVASVRELSGLRTFRWLVPKRQKPPVEQQHDAELMQAQVPVPWPESNCALLITR